MSDDLKGIETTDVDALLELRREQQGLEALIEKAQASRSKVPEAVFARVMRDYEERRRLAEEKARPLRQKARVVLARLNELHERFKASLETAQLDQSELEFRHEIGELSPAEFEKRAKTAAAALEASQRAFDEADELKQRFLDVLPPDAEPAPSVAPVVAPSPPVPAPAHPPALEPPDTGTVALPALELEPLDTIEPEPASTDFGTVVLSRDEAQALEAGDFGTVVAPNASLVRLDASGKPGLKYHLGLLVGLGRTLDNEIAIELPEVSRRHARLSYSDGGYVIQDLNSNNGTYVNGERTSEARLQDGDEIQIGPAIFVFSER